MNVTFIVGPTASGKSEVALYLAQENRGAIINCDSIQCYQGLDIGSAKPTQEDRDLVPHFLFDIVKKGETLTAGEYCRHFYELAPDLEKRFENIYVVGGTGFYFQALEKGMYAIGAAEDATIKSLESRLATEGAEALHKELSRLDSQSAQKISVNDHYRLVRALEINLTHKKTVSEVKEEFEKSRTKFPYPLKKVGIQKDREHLRKRIRARVLKMLDQGLIEEVKDLINEGFRDWSPLSSVGYREVVDFLEGRLAHDQLVEQIVISTSQLAKKQRTWFKRDQEIEWISK